MSVTTLHETAPPPAAWPATPIQRLSDLRSAVVRQIKHINASDPDDDEMAALVCACAEIDARLLDMPSKNFGDLAAKLAIWRELIEGPVCINEEDHTPLFDVLIADVRRLVAGGD